jgi:calcyclin binding protein
MYEEGDDNMRRTIAQAMIDARSGKKADPMRGLP